MSDSRLLLDLRDSHLLALEDELAELKANLGVVDDEGSLACGSAELVTSFRDPWRLQLGMLKERPGSR